MKKTQDEEIMYEVEQECTIYEKMMLFLPFVRKLVIKSYKIGARKGFNLSN